MLMVPVTPSLKCCFPGSPWSSLPRRKWRVCGVFWIPGTEIGDAWWSLEFYVNLCGIFVDGFLGDVPAHDCRGDWLYIENLAFWNHFHCTYSCSFGGSKLCLSLQGAFLLCFVSCSRTFWGGRVFHLCSQLNGFSFLSFEPLSWICRFFFSASSSIWRWKRFRTLLCTKLQAELTGFSFFRGGAVQK